MSGPQQAPELANMDEASIIASLSVDERQSVWDEAEAKFWASFEKKQEEQRLAIKKVCDKASDEHWVAYSTACKINKQLRQTRKRLARELSLVERKLKANEELHKRIIDTFSAALDDYDTQEGARLALREQVVNRMRAFFRRRRLQGAIPSAEQDPLQLDPFPSLHHAALHLGDEAEFEMAPPLADEPPSIVHSDGTLLGEVASIEPWNNQSWELDRMPIIRDIYIRYGRNFTKQKVDAINSEMGHARWLACMLQAKGEVQDSPCQACVKNQGIFAECVFLPDSSFLKCANCEWNRLRCRFPPQAPSTGPRKTPTKIEPSDSVSDQSALRSIPTPSSRAQPDSSPSRPLLLPPDALEEITSDNLLLRHDGTVYTHPEIMEGVPVAKIFPGHPYWEPDWQPLEPSVQQQLDLYIERHEIVLEEGAPARFQTRQQVTRGTKIMEFLAKGDISPYQLVAKKYMSAGMRGFTTYETLFRLCETLSELSRYEIGIHPLDWLRQRLHERWLENRRDFHIGKTINRFYSDAKLSALRSKCGFKRIGRPSGFKAGPSTRKPKAPKRPVYYIASPRPIISEPGVYILPPPPPTTDPLLQASASVVADPVVPGPADESSSSSSSSSSNPVHHSDVPALLSSAPVS